MSGARTSLIIAVVVLAISAAIGVLLGGGHSIKSRRQAEDADLI